MLEPLAGGGGTVLQALTTLEGQLAARQGVVMSA